MLYEELHKRFGSHIASRVQLELTSDEFQRAVLEELCEFLEQRAETAHKEYQTRHDNPFITDEIGEARAKTMNIFYQRWRDAEDLAYLVSVAENVGAATRLMMAETK